MKARVIASALALLLVGVGDMPRSSAIGPDVLSSFVPITPCRLMDTRAGAQVGPRGTPIDAGETYAAMVWGSNGNCVIPATATAVSLNVTFVGPTASGFVTVYPPDQTWPGTSNLNFSAGQAPAPNGVTSPLSADGKIGFFNFAGQVNLIADIVGYYQETGPPDANVMLGGCASRIRWELDRCVRATYETGDEPMGVAFDGVNVWVANAGDSTVSRINPHTGAKSDFPAATRPVAVAFDGTSIWTANRNDDSVSRFNTATGTRTDFGVGESPEGIAFDGTSIWVTARADDSVWKVNIATGAATGFPVGDSPLGVAFDGTNMWVANSGSGTMSIINPATGALVNLATAGAGAHGVAFDGTNVWVSNNSASTVSRIDPLTLTKQDFSTESGPTGIAFDGTSILVTASLDGLISKIDPVTGMSVELGLGSGPDSIAFDGSNAWVTNSADDTVSKVVTGGDVVDIHTAEAAEPSSFIPITPCRLMDTRPGSQVGPRGTPINPGETYAPTVWGSTGNCTIPSSATAVALNVTFVAPTAAGFVAVFPPDQPWPGNSNLNFSAGQAPAPNNVTSPLSADGKLGFLNAFGQVHLLADIVGYYDAAAATPGALVFGNCASLLRWDLAGCRPATFAAGNEPSGVAFDGTHLWVTNFTGNTISKINPTTGAKTDYPTPLGPTGVAFDGTNIWYANYTAQYVSRFNPVTGTRTDFQTDDGPMGVVFDGTSIWVTNSDEDTFSKYNPVTGSAVAYNTDLEPWGIAFDGEYLWIANRGDSSVTKMDRDGSEVAVYATESSPTGVVFDGTSIWVTNAGSASVTQIYVDSGTTINYPTGITPTGIAFDGTSIWVSNQGSDSVSKMDIWGDAPRVDYPVGDSPAGVAFDGGNIWVANALGDSVSKVVASGPDLRLSAIANPGSSAFVPITPCRLMDTRPGSTVGPRNTPIGPGETYTPLVWGTNGNCTIPANATAVSLNVTFVGPTSAGFVTVYPSDQPWPGTSNLNFTAGQAPAPNGVTSPLSNFGRIAFFNSAGAVHLLADVVGYYAPAEVMTTRCLPTLRWDLDTCDEETIDTGSDPFGMAFDGTNVWVANNLDDSVSRINTVTGDNDEFPVGDSPTAVAFDGTHIWVTNYFGNTVSKVDPGTGAELAEYPLPGGGAKSPRGIAFDGTSLWITGEDADGVWKMNPADGVATFHATGDRPWGVLYDGKNIFVTNRNDDNVSKIDPASGAVLTEFTTGDQPYGMGFDGTYLWVANVNADTISRIDPFTGAKTDYASGDGAGYFAFDGTDMWVVCLNILTVLRINVATGEAFPMSVGGNPYGILFDGNNVWVTSVDDDNVRKLVI